MRRWFTPPRSTPRRHTTAQVKRLCRGRPCRRWCGHVWRSFWQISGTPGQSPAVGGRHGPAPHRRGSIHPLMRRLAADPPLPGAGTTVPSAPGQGVRPGRVRGRQPAGAPTRSRPHRRVQLGVAMRIPMRPRRAGVNRLDQQGTEHPIGIGNTRLGDALGSGADDGRSRLLAEPLGRGRRGRSRAGKPRRPGGSLGDLGQNASIRESVQSPSTDLIPIRDGQRTAMPSRICPGRASP
jgi:hypothetical protein